MPLILVLLALGLAIVLPQLTQRRIARLRNEINNVEDPAQLRVVEIQLEMAMQASQRRGYLLTGDEELAKQFQLSRQQRITAERDLLGYSREIDQWATPGLAGAVRRLISLDNDVDSLVAARGAVSAAALDRQRRTFLEAQRLSDSIGTKIGRAAESRRAAVAETENVVGLVTAFLLLLGIGAAVLVARLGGRFRALALRLDEQEARFRQITENLTAVVLLSDPEFRQALYVNDAYERIWGCSRESLEANPASFMERVHPEDRERVWAAVRELGERPADLEFRLVQPGGDVRWVWGRAFPVRNADGRVFRIAGIFEDVTERHEYAEERERLLEREHAAREIAERRRSELERVSESRARLVRGFTHDVKNPLGAADGYLALLEEGVVGTVSDQQRTTVAKVRRSIRHALELIAHLLDIARAEAGQLEIRRREIDLGAAVCDIAEAFTAQAKSKELTIDVMVEHNLPLVETDPTRLRQVVGNLISNAVKYTARGGHISVRTCLQAAPASRAGSDGEIAISVTDDGPGIPRDKLPHLFTEFTRFDPGAAEGAGIGLAISQSIARALGGEISVESKVGEGSTFVLHLPVTPAVVSDRNRLERG